MDIKINHIAKMEEKRLKTVIYCRLDKYTGFDIIKSAKSPAPISG